jgi:hypothetical protein
MHEMLAEPLDLEAVKAGDDDAVQARARPDVVQPPPADDPDRRARLEVVRCSPPTCAAGCAAPTSPR